MPMFYGQIMMQKYLEDPAISFCAIGDAIYDRAPLQISEFGQGKEIDQLISKMYLEGGGGGNYEESYELPAYFYRNHCLFTNARKPFFFVTGDEGFFSTVEKSHILKVMGFSPDKDYNGQGLWKDLMTRFNVFLIKKDYGGDHERIIYEQWKNAIGAERILRISEPKACIDIMLGAICLTSGSRNLDGYLKDMKIREQTNERIAEVTKSLKPYWDLLSAKKILPVEATNELSGNKRDFTEYSEIAEKVLLMSLEEDEERDLYKSLKELSSKLRDQIPAEYLCPITGSLFFDPVIASDQQTYERKAFEAWILNNDRSPVTNITLVNKEVMSNLVLKKLVLDFLSKNK